MTGREIWGWEEENGVKVEGRTEAMFTEFSLENAIRLRGKYSKALACIPVNHNKQRPDMHEGLDEDISSESDSGLL